MGVLQVETGLQVVIWNPLSYVMSKQNSKFTFKKTV